MNAIDAMIADGSLTDMVCKALPDDTTVWINARACRVATGEPTEELLAMASRLREMAQEQGGTLANAWGMKSAAGKYGFEFAIAPPSDARVGEITWKIGTRPQDMLPAKIRLPRQVRLSFGCYSDVVMAAHDLNAILELSGISGAEAVGDLAQRMGYRSSWTPQINSLDQSMAIIPLRPVQMMEAAA